MPAPTPPAAPKPPLKAPPKPLRFGPPEKRNWIALIAFWIFVIGALGASVWLFQRSPRLRPLDCGDTSGMGSLTSFGHCHEGN